MLRPRKRPSTINLAWRADRAAWATVTSPRFRMLAPGTSKSTTELRVPSGYAITRLVAAPLRGCEVDPRSCVPMRLRIRLSKDVLPGVVLSNVS